MSDQQQQYYQQQPEQQQYQQQQQYYQQQPEQQQYQQQQQPDQYAGDDGAGGSSDDEWNAPVRCDEGAVASSGPKVVEVDFDRLEGEERELAGDVVPIVFVMPAGETFRRLYVMGHTIAFIKGQLEDLIGVDYARMTLRMNGKTLIDPLSLNDLPSFRPREDNIVEVVIA